MATVTVAPAHPRRFREIVLMLLALAAGIGGYVLTTLNRTGEVPQNLGRHVLVLVVLAVVAEVGMHWLAPYADPVILPIAVALSGIGLAMIYRLDLSYRALNEAGQDPPYALVGFRQLMFVAIGVALAAVVLVLVRDHRTLRRYTWTFGVISLVLLLLPMVPGLGVETNGSRVWIDLGVATFQPGELVKITLAIFFAGYLVSNRDNLAIGGPKVLGMRLPRARDLGPILVVWLLGVAILVLQRDLGTSLLFFGLFVVMLYTATSRVSWLVIGAVLFTPAVVLAVRLFSHVRNRFDIWLHAMDPRYYDADPGSGQLVRGLFGQASGGLMGTGWGRGYPQLVPFANSDFILSSLGEELGLTGIAAILVLYLILIERGLRAAIGVRDGFGKLLAAGLSLSLALQVFVVLGGITRLIPLTGLTAPFLAAGGSSMLSSWITVALLVRISDAARRPATVPAPWSTGILARIPALTERRRNTPTDAGVATTRAGRSLGDSPRPGAPAPGADRGGASVGGGAATRGAATGWSDVGGSDVGGSDVGAATGVIHTGGREAFTGDAHRGDARAARSTPARSTPPGPPSSPAQTPPGPPSSPGATPPGDLRIIDGDLPDDPDYPREPRLSAPPPPAPEDGGARQ